MTERKQKNMKKYYDKEFDEMSKRIMGAQDKCEIVEQDGKFFIKLECGDLLGPFDNRSDPWIMLTSARLAELVSDLGLMDMSPEQLKYFTKEMKRFGDEIGEEFGIVDKRKLQ